jgi:hypothetical protein
MGQRNDKAAIDSTFASWYTGNRNIFCEWLIMPCVYYIHTYVLVYILLTYLNYNNIWFDISSGALSQVAQLASHHCCVEQGNKNITWVICAVLSCFVIWTRLWEEHCTPIIVLKVGLYSLYDVKMGHRVSLSYDTLVMNHKTSHYLCINIYLTSYVSQIFYYVI